MHDTTKNFSILIFALLVILVFGAMIIPSQAGQPKTILVSSTADSGPGTLRQALLDVGDGETISFDTAVFPIEDSAVIRPQTALPHIYAHNMILDASNAGVILEGSLVQGDWEAGLQLVSAVGSQIRGLQISNFSGPGVAISGEARENIIGGDPHQGSGPQGQGNFFSGNDMGISIATSETSANSVTGNFIGIDKTGLIEDGNRTGIWISEQAHGNTIGPANIIAHNDHNGVVISGPGTLGNRISRNSIHDNGWKGIDLSQGGNADLQPPLLYDYDLAGGSLNGAACANCTLEIFSDSGDEGALYEGTAMAGADGFFSFQKGSAFAGPYLTVTASDASGNTSEFSLPTTRPSRSLVLQQGNHFPYQPYWALCSSELLENHIASLWGYLENTLMGGDFACDPQKIRGLKRVRFTFNEMEDWPYIDWNRPETIQPDQDAFISRLADSGIAITYVLTFWDKANHPNGWPPVPSRFTNEEEIQRYLQYVRSIVHKLKGRVDLFEVWNEPDNQGSAIQHITPEDYINLVRRVVPVIKDEYPAAKVVAGGVVLRDPYAQQYLDTLVHSDVMPIVDVVSWHPFFGTAPDNPSERDYYTAYPAMAEAIRATALANGFQGEFHGDELGWCSPDLPDCGGASMMHSNTQAAKYYGRGIAMHRGWDMPLSLGGLSDLRPESSTMISNMATAFAGATAKTWPIQVGTTLTNVVSYTFTLPNGGSMVALWTDDAAQDFDPGLPLTLAAPGLKDQVVVAVDPLHSIKQELVISAEADGLIIRDLLVKDYPILVFYLPQRAAYLPVVLQNFAAVED